MKSLKFISLLLFVLIVAVSCKKETGPAGANGTNGTNGINGVNGVTGTTGTANVIYSPWILFDDAKWGALVNLWGKNMRIYTDSIPAITPSILDNGVVLVYVKVGGDLSSAYALPWTMFNMTQSVHQYLGLKISLGAFSIPFYNLDDNLDPGTISGSYGNAYRYIIIPGGTPVAGAKISNEELKAMNYIQACNYLNIAE
jgi:hypothetical protein